MTKNILRIDASLRKAGSYSRDLTDKLIKQLSVGQDAGDVNHVMIRDLVDGIPLIDEAWTIANFSAADERTAEQNTCLEFSGLLVEELNTADEIVIGLPIYNFGVPTAFKAWLDQVTRSKLTFRYTDEGPLGLLNNKKAYVVIVSGGTKLGSELDYVSDYLRHVLGFIGITDVSIIDSSGLGRDEAKTIANAHELINRI